MWGLRFRVEFIGFRDRSTVLGRFSSRKCFATGICIHQKAQVAYQVTVPMLAF